MTDDAVNPVPEEDNRLDQEGGPLLAKMPLHAITSVHGEAGLRERLVMEISQFSPRDRDRAHEALALASRLHAHDRRQREPYMNHLLTVTVRILSHYGLADADVTCAAILHDSVEDHGKDIASDGTQQAAFAVLAGMFGERVAELVAAVTNPVYEPGRDQHQQYREHVIASLQANPWARVIKASDLTDNGVGVIHTTGPKAVRLARKYAPLVPVLADVIARPDTPLSPHAKERILRQFRTAQERFAAIDPSTADSSDTRNA